MKKAIVLGLLAMFSLSTTFAQKPEKAAVKSEKKVCTKADSASGKKCCAKPGKKCCAKKAEEKK